LLTFSSSKLKSEDELSFLFPNLNAKDKQSPTKTNITKTDAADLNPVATATIPTAVASAPLIKLPISLLFYLSNRLVYLL
jgi:hypothetical protein